MLSRLAESVVVVFFAATIAFILLQLAPGDQATALGETVSPEVRAAYRERLGLDQPVPTQYLRWMSAIAQGDFGWSSGQQRPVAALLRDAIPNTLLLMGSALVLSLSCGVVLGAWQGAHANTRRDTAISSALLLLYSIPEFLLALLLLLLFAFTLRWFPSGGITDDLHRFLSPPQQWLDRVKHLALPLLSLSVVTIAIFARYQRAAMRDAMTQPFIQTARAKGLSEAQVRRHARRAAVLPVITVTGLLFPSLLGGAVVVEQIFAWPGMGWVLMRGIGSRDTAVVAAAVIVGSAMTALGALLAEIAREVVDPRVRHT